MSFDRLGDHRRQSADDLFQLGRSAVKNGDRAQARRLLEQAVEYNRDHSDAWLWLSATTDDPLEQKHYLEWAIAANPANAAARRGLGIVTGRLNPKEIMPENAPPKPEAPTEPEETSVRRTFKCPQCGGTLRFDPEIVDLKCESCGYVEVVEEVPIRDREQVLDFNLPTRKGHGWAEAERRFTCQQCGAATILPKAQTSDQCPFCGSVAFVAAPEEGEMLPPQGVIPMGLEVEQVRKVVKAWLGRGFFAPDDLALLARDSRLRPAYVPFWTFNATLNAHWGAHVAEGHGRNQRWVWRTGERIFFYTDHLQPGTRALPADLLAQIKAFDLSNLVEYKPEYLAGWPAVTYDISLADASLAAREAMIAAAKKELVFKAAGGAMTRDLEVTGSDFTGQTYKFVMLPLWVGVYRYQGKTFRVLVNGQTGKVVGDKPVDQVKVILLILVGIGVMGILALLALYFLR
jgi:DNA-directed RNA polymerase subunit RPC12/RpoP